MDPVAPGTQQRVRVLLNRRMVGLLDLSWDPERVGSYRVTLPAEAVRAGRNELVIIPEHTVAAGDAGPRFAWLERGRANRRAAVVRAGAAVNGLATGRDGAVL